MTSAGGRRGVLAGASHTGIGVIGAARRRCDCAERKLVSSMTVKRARMAMAVVTWLTMGSGSAAYAQGELVWPPKRARVAEAGLDFGMSVAGVEVGRDTNATGGEQLIATLGHGAVLGVRMGVHSPSFGFDAALSGTSAYVKVRNEFGVRFPNHGERPAVLSGRVLLYPFRRAIGRGQVRPFLAAGVAGALVSADLDNIEDQSLRLLPGWTFGAGVKWLTGGADGGYLEVAVGEHRFHGVGPFGSFETRTVTCGVGYRFSD
jgi:opacity protein-like surface antigen